VQFDERVDIELKSGLIQVFELPSIQRFGDEQHCVGITMRGLPDLERINDKVFAEYRKLYLLSDTHQIFNMPLKKLLVG
jgi:hypothetical protein